MENFQNLDQLLSSYLSDDKEERINNTRFMLGELESQFTNEQLEIMLADFDYLAGKWLDQFERNLLSGKTIIEMSR